MRSIDLHPFATIGVESYPDITFRGPGGPTGYAVGADEPHKVKSALAERMPAVDLDDATEVTADRDGVVFTGRDREGGRHQTRESYQAAITIASILLWA